MPTEIQLSFNTKPNLMS